MSGFQFFYLSQRMVPVDHVLTAKQGRQGYLIRAYRNLTSVSGHARVVANTWKLTVSS